MKRVLALAPLMILTLALASCSDVSDTSKVAAAPPVALPIAPIPPRPDDSAFVASGPVVVENQVDVAALREGVVVSILAEPNTHVGTGQLLAQLDDRQISADLEAARAKTRSTEDDLKNWEAEAKVLDSDYARAEKMWEAKIIPQEQLDHAKYKAESDQWDVKRVSELLTNAKQTEQSLELELEKTQITAPFNGIVARRYVRVGQTVARNDRLFWVTAIGPLQIRVTLPEKFLGHIKSGSVIAVTPAEDLSSDRHYRAKVIEVSPVVDPASDTIEIMAELSGDTSGLRPGMRANVHVPDVK